MANEQGQWYQWTFTDRQKLTVAEAYKATKLFYASMQSGQVKVNYSDLAGQQAPAGGATAGAIARDVPNDIEA